MRHIKTRTWLAVLSSLLALALAACAGGDNGGAATPAGGNGGDESTPAGETVPVGDPVEGQTLFTGTCSSCHGPDGTGITGLGKDLTTSEFTASLSDAELIEFIKTGRPATDPANTTGVDMPPKGGNPALTDQDIADIVAYLRTIHP